MKTVGSGFLVPGQARDIQPVRTPKGNLYIVQQQRSAAHLPGKRISSLIRGACFDEDHAVRAANTVRTPDRRHLQDFNRRDMCGLIPTRPPPDPVWTGSPR